MVTGPRSRTGSNVAAGDRTDERRHALIERVSHIGSFAWDARTNRVTWSPELYRIYGLGPDAFAGTFEAFLDRVHPDDRAEIAAAVTEAFRTRTPYHFTERIVRPDGEVRTLETWGEVIVGEGGDATGVVGICQDVTDALRAARVVRETEIRYRRLIETAPDAIVVVDADGTITEVNPQTEALFGYASEELVGLSIEQLLPERFREIHGKHRGGFMAAPRSRAMGADLELFARRKDGSEFPVDVSLAAHEGPGGLIATAFVRDVTERKRAEEFARRLHDAGLRRRQALEINDNLVQGLAAAVYAFDSGQTNTARAALERTLDAARSMMSDLLEETRGEAPVSPGDLVRARPAEIGVMPPEPLAPPLEGPSGLIRVVIADDTPDIRLLLRLSLDRPSGFEVVGEAADGAEALELVEEFKPDVVLLDLAMPRMDGLQALPLIKRRSASTRIVVLSGFDDDRISAQALALGADAFVKKGSSPAGIVRVLRDLTPAKAASSASKANLSATELDDKVNVSELSHELRQPLSVIQGLASTVRVNLGAIDEAMTTEILERIERNAAHMIGLLGKIEDRPGALPVRTDIGSFVDQTLTDLSEMLGGRALVVEAPRGTALSIDRGGIRQILTNLLSNAVKYGDDGTPVEVEVRTTRGVVEVSMTSHGPPIPEGRRSHLFGRFRRVDGHDARDGQGLGLAIARRIAREHGGELELARSDATGTEFVLKLPGL